MNTLFTIIFFGFLSFYFFMVTPFGICWILKNLEESKPCYGVIIMFLSIVPVMIIGSFLGFIK